MLNGRNLDRWLYHLIPQQHKIKITCIYRPMNLKAHRMASSDLFQPQLFLDDYWIEDSAFVTRVWHQARKFPEPVLRAEHPWEQWCPSAYGTVLHWRGQFHMWYVNWTMTTARRACY